jgi:release factor glutamine methyltransferase
MTLHAAISWAQQILKEGGIDSARIDGERILSFVLDTTPSKLMLSDRLSITKDEESELQALLDRRKLGEPLAYIIGKQGFYKHYFSVRPGVLIPRPESEALVELALQHAKPTSRFADFGCGSGCVGLSLLKDWPHAFLVAVDVSATAVEVTAQNAAQLEITERCRILQSSILEIVFEEEFDLIVANPPYIANGDERVEGNVKQHEPHEALFAGPQGTECIFAWSEIALKYLKKDGLFIVEIGTGQSPVVKAKLIELGFRDVQIHFDLAGHDRTLVARK